ncbi:MAG: membrane protein insertion efficiency factor YidD [Candidatus Pacebacteria bacterium]|nr:membrane protein insertion efficiency factor YidD [Candidatus Paceibacterota bacterium]
MNPVRSKSPQGDCSTRLLARAASNGINFYQKNISIFLKANTCVFYPSCSEYTKQAIEKYGAWKGIYLGLKRILRCHPWQKNHIDSVK